MIPRISLGTFTQGIVRQPCQGSVSRYILNNQKQSWSCCFGREPRIDDLAQLSVWVGEGGTGVAASSVGRSLSAGGGRQMGSMVGRSFRITATNDLGQRTA